MCRRCFTSVLVCVRKGSYNTSAYIVKLWIMPCYRFLASKMVLFFPLLYAMLLCYLCFSFFPFFFFSWWSNEPGTSHVFCSLFLPVVPGSHSSFNLTVGLPWAFRWDVDRRVTPSVTDAFPVNHRMWGQDRKGQWDERSQFHILLKIMHGLFRYNTSLSHYSEI